MKKPNLPATGFKLFKKISTCHNFGKACWRKKIVQSEGGALVVLEHTHKFAHKTVTLGRVSHLSHVKIH